MLAGSGLAGNAAEKKRKTGEAQSSRSRSRKRQKQGPSQFYDAVEALPGRGASPAAAAAQPLAPRASNSSALKSTAASPPRPRPPPPSPPPQQQRRAAPAAVSTSPVIYRNGNHVRVEMVILPSPEGPAMPPGRKKATGGGGRGSGSSSRGARGAPAAAGASKGGSAVTAGEGSGGGAKDAGGEGKGLRSTKKKKKPKKKTLSAKGKRAAVLKAVALTPAPQQPPASDAAAAAPVPVPAADAAAAPAPSATGPAPAPAAAPAVWTANLGKSWSKADIMRLARLGTDSQYLLETIPAHPPTGAPDWELISKYFGRYSKGGAAVQSQFRQVQRVMKQARGEGRRGANYVDLVKMALEVLPGRQGTVLDVQKVLKRDHSSCLDKYQDGGTTRWKKAVGEALKGSPALFEKVDKTNGGKIVWRLKGGAAGAVAGDAS